MSALVESMAWVKDRGLPWWVGTEQDQARMKTELEGLATGQEIRAAAGLDWPVLLKPIYVGRKGPKVEGKFATVRGDTGAALGVVGSAYRVIQNDVLDALGDAIVDSGEAKYETAGSLRSGKTVFLSMELGHLGIKVAGDDAVDEAVKTYLVLTNSHDGNKALECAITPIRVVCVNTLNMALGAAKANFKIRHSGSVDGKILAAREALGISFSYMERFGEVANELALKQLVDSQVQDIFRAVWPVSEDISDSRLEAHASSQAFELYKTSENLDPIRGTAWGTMNAVAEFIDWGTPYKGRTAKAFDVRSDSILWGRAQDRKEKALSLLLSA